jgi:hypothetical protein
MRYLEYFWAAKELREAERQKAVQEKTKLPFKMVFEGELVLQRGKQLSGAPLIVAYRCCAADVVRARLV